MDADIDDDGEPRRDRPGQPYKVGYGKPPPEHQYKKGQSGNPRGRQKGSRALKTDLHEALSHTVTVTINGKPIKGTTQFLMLLTLCLRGANGDLKGAQILAPLILKVFGPDERGGQREALSPAEEAAYQALLALIEGVPLGSDGGDAADDQQALGQREMDKGEVPLPTISDHDGADDADSDDA